MKPSVIWWKAVTTFYRRMVVVTKDVDATAPSRPPQIDVSIRPLTDQDIDAYFIFRPREKRHEIERRVAAGHICFAAWHGASIVHAGWSATGRVHIPYIHSDILLSDDAFYIYDSYTLPDFRRSNLVVARSSVMHAFYAERGKRRSFGVVARMNRAGLAIVGPAGYREIGMYGCVRMGGLHHTWPYAGATEPLPALAPHAR